MKSFKMLFIVAFVMMNSVVFGQNSQVDFSSPQYAMWGDTPDEREKNMFLSTYMREAFNNKQYDEAIGYFQELIGKRPAASDAIYARALQIYQIKIGRAADLQEKKMMVDSLMYVHNLRLEHFHDHPQRGAAYITDARARDFYNFSKSDREGLRDVFKEAIEMNGANIDLELVLLYYRNLCDDYKMDLVMADEIMAEYDRLSPLVEQNEAMKEKLDTAFGASGVATCENLEAIFKERIAAAPDDFKMLSLAVRLMSRAGCKTPFYAEIAERQYQQRPDSRSAMVLASIFQGDGDYDKAAKYLRDALASETDMEEQEQLQTRIALVEYAASNMTAAMKAASAAMATNDGTLSDNGIAMFIIAQCYAANAPSCEDELKGRAGYWAAADMMRKALINFRAEEATYKEHAQDMLKTYRSNFPSAEDCFFAEIAKGSEYKIKCGLAAGTMTTVRTRD